MHIIDERDAQKDAGLGSRLIGVLVGRALDGFLTASGVVLALRLWDVI